MKRIRTWDQSRPPNGEEPAAERPEGGTATGQLFSGEDSSELLRSAETASQRQPFEALLELAGIACEPGDLTGTCGQVVSCLMEEARAQAGLVALYDDSDHSLTAVRSAPGRTEGGVPARRIDLKQDSFLQLTLAEGQTRLYPGPPLELPSAALLADWQVESVVAMPLRLGSVSVGVIFLGGAAESFTPAARALLDSLAAQAAVLINNARLSAFATAAKREWEATFDAITDAVFVYDERGLITRANWAALKLAGVGWAQLRGQPYWRGRGWTHDELSPVRTALATGRRCTAEAESNSGGETLIYAVEVDPILDDHGWTIGAVEILRDITPLRRARREALQQRDFFESLVENAFDAIFTVDPAGRLTWFNHHTAVLTGYSPAELQGLSVDSLVSSDAPVRMGFFFREVAQGRPQVFETRIHRPDGELVDLLVTAAPVRERGRVTGSIGIARNITDQKRLNERMTQSDKLRALGELASGVAHDFNNILSVILGRAQLLQGRIEEERVARELGLIIQAALDGGQTVRRIQNFARVRADHNFAAVNLNQIVTDAVSITRTRWKHDAERQGCSIVVTTELAPAAKVSGDASELREVLVNLIFNAIDALPEGGRINIRTEAAESVVRLTVSDTGVGMSEAVKGRIFDPFFTTKGAQGTGLGLSVSYGIITRHNGSIEVTSEVGQGTSFIITLPSHYGPEESAPAAPTPVYSLGRVLVVDDEPTVRELLVDTLEAAGYTVVCATGGGEAIELAQREHFDLVLTDLGMPGMNGWEVARSIKKIDPELPVLLITGWGVELGPEALPGSGVDGVVSKPFDLETILKSVSDQLAGRKKG